jgi:hypothetical protein
MLLKCGKTERIKNHFNFKIMTTGLKNDKINKCFYVSTDFGILCFNQKDESIRIVTDKLVIKHVNKLPDMELPDKDAIQFSENLRKIAKTVMQNATVREYCKELIFEIENENDSEKLQGLTEFQDWMKLEARIKAANTEYLAVPPPVTENKDLELDSTEVQHPQ